MKPKNNDNNKAVDFEEVVSFTEKELEEIRKEAIRKAKQAKHRWRQQGRWLICKSCEYQHAVFVGNKVMVGEDKDGNPIFEDRDKAIKNVVLSLPSRQAGGRPSDNVVRLKILKRQYGRRKKTGRKP